jgi:hypothetical protein
MKSIVTGVKENILLYYDEILDDPHHRYRSWEHCCSCFQRLQSSKDLESIDAGALHLAFYLASWGMYRGSSQLLQKDYTVHTPIVQELLEEKYSQLWSLDFDTLNTEAPEVSLVIQLAKRLRRIYAELQVSPTDTLVTKVLLGTFACIPAYDTLFMNGVTYWKQGLPPEFKPKFPAQFGINSYRGLIDFYREHKSDFKEAQDSIAAHGIDYPVMKLTDMYFWSLGYQLGR